MWNSYQVWHRCCHVQDLRRLHQCDAFILDMDGTLYLDETLMPGALNFVHFLQKEQIPHLYLTNNSSRSGTSYQERLLRLGICVTRDQILTSGDATIDYIITSTPYRSAYLVATTELAKDFLAAGIDLDASDPDCVVVAYDTEFTFDKLERACSLLFANKPYFATHPDRTCITQRGLIPDIAAIIAACNAVTQRSPKIIGKPNGEIVRTALVRMNARAETTAMIGDQLDTDMAMAQNHGLCGVLLPTGETTKEKLSRWPGDQKDFLLASSMSELLRWISQRSSCR